ncbi:MAG: copper chaperone PCu(A)C [Anaerolineae bacterium]
MRKLAWLVLIGVMVVTACAPAAAPGPKITVEAVWGRSSPKVAGAGAFYLNIKNTGSEADKLVGAKSDACGTVELHETVDKGGGMMEMQPIAGQTIEIKAGTTVELKPGGMHVMCMMKKADFKAGDKYSITLVFEKSGEIKVDADIKDTAM